MRKICALVMTSFYLLLSTGGYACLLHCTTDYLAVQFAKNKHEAQLKGEDHDHGETQDDEDCKSGDCNCCYHHGTYVVSENFNHAADLQLLVAQVPLVLLNNDPIFISPVIVKPDISWPGSTGPPFLYRPPLYIANRTLLI